MQLMGDSTMEDFGRVPGDTLRAQGHVIKVIMSAPARCYVWCTARGGRSHAFLQFHAYLQHYQLALHLHPAPCTLNSIPHSGTSPMHMRILLCAAL